MTWKKYKEVEGGSTIAWSTTYTKSPEWGGDIVAANIAVARASEIGAIIEYFDHDTGQEFHRHFEIEGLVGAVALRALIARNDSGVEQAEDSPVEARLAIGGEASEVFVKGYRAPNGIKAFDERRLFDDPQEMFGSLRSELGSENSSLFSIIYYGYNILANGSDEWDIPLIPLAVMAEETSSQHRVVENILETYHEINREDQNMLRSLTSPDAAELFVGSRRSVAKLESDVAALADEQAYLSMAYRPTGFRPGGRTWPYMNAMAKEEKSAFETELHELLGGDTLIPRRELESELAELDRRIRIAIDARSGLARLSSLEEATS